jgi:hypothetical protein
MRRHGVVGARRLLSSRRSPERFSSLSTALKVFHEQNDHFVVPHAFQVPQESPPNATDFPWPEETLGLSLGQEIREFVAASGSSSSPALLDTRRQLDTVGFPQVRDWKRFLWEQGALSALKRYKEVHRDLLVPRKFVVPREDPQWPQPTWGMNLGARVNSLRQKRKKLQEYQVQDLDAVGFVWVVADYTWDVLFMPALRRYRELYGNCEVPQAFVVGEGPDEDNVADKWPAELEGYRLGRMVNRIRAASVFLEYMERDRKELEELGFYLNSNDQKWQETILPAFETFNRIHGDCNIHKLFTVPEEKLWPPSTWGIRLGFIAQNIRNRGDYFRQVARDFERLEEIGFVWKSMAMPMFHPTSWCQNKTRGPRRRAV